MMIMGSKTKTHGRTKTQEHFTIHHRSLKVDKKTPNILNY